MPIRVQVIGQALAIVGINNNYMATRKTKRQKYTDEEFTDAQALQDFFRSGKTLKYDYVTVNKVLYTLEEYDMEGDYMTYANDKHKLQLRVDTSNRYGALGFTDATVYLWPVDYVREGITYAE